MTAAMKLKDAWFLEEKLWDQTRENIKKQRHYFTNKGLSSQSYGFSSSHIWMWELDYKESWVLNNWCFWTVVLEKNLESPLDCKEIQTVNPKGNQSWIFIGRTDAEAETPIFWQPEEPTHWKRPWCWQRLKVGGEGHERRWGGWMTSPMQWTWLFFFFFFVVNFVIHWNETAMGLHVFPIPIPPPTSLSTRSP